MAITVGTVEYPSLSGVAKTASQSGQLVERPLYGKVEVTLDDTLTSFEVPYIDGTKVISPVPVHIIGHRIGGNTTATIQVVSCTPTDGAKFTVEISAPGAGSDTLILGFKVF